MLLAVCFATSGIIVACDVRVDFFDLDIRPANRIVNGLLAFGNGFSDFHFFDDSGLLADDRFFGARRDVDFPFPKVGQIRFGNITIYGMALYIYMLFAKRDVFFDRSFGDLRVNADSAGLDFALADLQFFFDDRDYIAARVDAAVDIGRPRGRLSHVM